MVRIRTATLALASLAATNAHAQVVATPTQRDYRTQPIETLANTPPGGFSAEINGSQKFSYDSNPLRVTTGEESIVGSTTSPELVLRHKTPTSLVESTTRIDANVYDKSKFNSLDVHENLKLERKNERWTAGLTTNFDRDTTRQSEITNYGSTKARVYSNRLNLAPQVEFRQNERDTWKLNSAFTQATFSDNTYSDYNFYTLAPTFEHAFDTQNTGRISLNAQRYETASGADSSSNSYGPSIGWTNKATNRLTLHADAGALTSEKKGATANVDEGGWDYVFSAGVTYQDIQNQLDVTASRAQQPFGNGTEALVNSIAARGTHAINDKLAMTGKAAYRTADYPDTQPGVNLDNEYSLGSGLAYRIMKETALTADYTYHQEELVNLPGTVNEHVVMVGVSFQPSWSRK